jgi:hypothetical protein
MYYCKKLLLTVTIITLIFFELEQVWQLLSQGNAVV